MRQALGIEPAWPYSEAPQTAAINIGIDVRHIATSWMILPRCWRRLGAHHVVKYARALHRNALLEKRLDHGLKVPRNLARRLAQVLRQIGSTPTVRQPLSGRKCLPTRSR